MMEFQHFLQIWGLQAKRLFKLSVLVEKNVFIDLRIKFWII